jgi:hypothetical protein
VRGVLGWQSVFAVRRNWPDGSHEFVQPRGTLAHARSAVRADRRFWRRGPIRPLLSVVEISLHDLDLHVRRHYCMAPDCPQPTDLEPEGASTGGGRW